MKIACVRSFSSLLEVSRLIFHKNSQHSHIPVRSIISCMCSSASPVMLSCFVRFITFLSSRCSLLRLLCPSRTEIGPHCWSQWSSDYTSPRESGCTWCHRSSRYTVSCSFSYKTCEKEDFSSTTYVRPLCGIIIVSCIGAM